MKRNLFVAYLWIWGAYLALFNLFVFVWPKAFSLESMLFWVAYLLIHASFAGQLVCAVYCLRSTGGHRSYYNLGVFQVSRKCLTVSLVVGIICMIFYRIPFRIGMLICAAVMVANIVKVVQSVATAELVADIDDRVKERTWLIHHMTSQAEALMRQNKSGQYQRVTKQVYEAIRFSDPMSHPGLAEIEADMEVQYDRFVQTIQEEKDPEQVQAEADKLMDQIKQRNSQCKLLK